VDRRTKIMTQLIWLTLLEGILVLTAIAVVADQYGVIPALIVLATAVIAGCGAAVAASLLEDLHEDWVIIDSLGDIDEGSHEA
jgi:hypothetical protein